MSALHRDSWERAQSCVHDPHWREKMSKELFFLFAVTLTCYAALHSPSPKMSSVPPPVPFLRSSTVLDDFYSGEFKTAHEKILLSEMSFVMYYAPWDAESQRARWHFEAAARYYHKEIYFVAINCWQPGSVCRQLNKIYTFPVFVLTPQRSPSQLYHGVREASHMIKFLKNGLRPVSVLHNQKDLVVKLSEHDAVVLCNLNFRDFKEDAEWAYNTFYEASRNFFDRDHMNDIAFTVVLDPDRIEFGEAVTGAASIHLFLWNETVPYTTPIEFWTQESITQWVSKSLQQATAWVQPPGVKSLTLSSYLKSGPVLVLFTPRNPLLHHVYYYNLLKEVAFSFYNCKDSCWINKLTAAVQKIRLRIQQHHRSLLRSCALWGQASNTRAGVTKVFCPRPFKFDAPVSSNNVSVSCTGGIEEQLYPPRGGFDYGYCGLLHYSADIPLDEEKKLDEGIVGRKEEPLFQRLFNYIGLMNKKPYVPNRLQCSQRIRGDMFNGLSSQLTGLGDSQWAAYLKEWAKLEKCRLLRHARLLHRPFFPTEQELDHSGIQGLRCSSNRTLSFLAFDSLQLPHFAESLGVDVLHRKDKSAVLILDPEAEAQYFLKGEINKVTLTDFIRDYISNQLPRWHRSSDVKPRSNGFSLGPTQTIHLSRYSARSHGECKENMVCVEELNFGNFRSRVLENNKNVVLFYYTPYCAFCYSVSHVFLTVAHALKSVGTLEFARIDGDNNDLPWEFTVHRFPSIIFFPSVLKSESHIFPAGTEVTVLNLVQFILSNLSPEERVWALLVVCEKGARRQPLSYQDQLTYEKCMTQVKTEVFQSASQLVNKYRSLLVNLQGSPAHEASQASRKHLQRQLAARLRFFRQATSILTSLSFSSPNSNRLPIVGEVLRQIKKAFFTLQDMQVHLTLSKTIATEEVLKLSVDLNDVKEKLRSLNKTIDKPKNVTLSYNYSNSKDEF